MELSAKHIQSLASFDALQAFFHQLAYDTSNAVEQTPSNLGISESVHGQIKVIQLIADQMGLLQVYLFELKSVTVVTMRTIVRAFVNRPGNYLLILTSDYERIDFVLCERVLPEENLRRPAHLPSKQATIHPRVLSVIRRKPSRVDLRVLSRFANTEKDEFAQYEKLLSAFSIAEWSEDEFNNRALFSDYYLKERLPDNPAFRERIEKPLQAITRIIDEAREKYTSAEESVFAEKIIQPLLFALGFGVKKGSFEKHGEYTPDFVLTADGDASSPVAYCQVYRYNRPLDRQEADITLPRAAENPTARIVSLLEQDQVDWAILTNGKEWRLFSKKAHSRATNYYEIDLEEVIREQDPEMFRYFYLFFRLSAFVPDQQGKTFLELIREESSDYAKQLEDRLKDRIYEKIFPYLADGFISNYSKQKDIPPYQMESLAPGCLKEVFPATLTLLYRLLFILYAESRDLLPVREEIGYGACGLKKLKEEIASAAGDEFEEVENKLKRKYGSGTDDNRLYKYLNSLFDLIGKGDPDRNLPQYDGGLFDSSLNPFFQENHVPDYHLACAIDHLARDEDEKTSRVVFIDYKSLGVRQLGSIYEGLLEFKVRMATEKMAFCQGKKTEILLPYAQAKKNKDIKVLKIGHGSQAEERTLSCGTVYLENDKHERKATGSYYTPDHIVKYIVRHAVGPVLDSKFKEMTSAIREAQKVYHAEQKKSKGLAASGIKADDPENQAYLKTRHVVDDLFNIRCLDPAMGSGHFLVECVDYITDRIVVFLDGFAPWNPVSAHLERTRRDILNQMDSQNITISERRLDPINLLKRHILKRCIYGVDLNPMAVALAKVSLWLDCFTIGAPLSFLDHHLKCGNSLISSDVETVREAISTYTNKQLTIFGSYWTGSLQALQGMLNVGFLPDATPSQAKESLTQYRKASDHLEPFRRMLDVYTSRWFGNEPVKKKGKIPEPTLDFLNDKEGEAWIYGKKSTEEVRPAFREIAEKVVKASQEKRFFHWDLEFPEVFYAPRPGTMQQIERAANAGFDAVIGNPPYDVLAEQELGYDLSQEFAYFRAAQIYSPAIKGKLNLYKLFISIALYLTRAKGTFSFIVPMGLLGDDQTAGVRHLLLNSSGLVSIEVFPQKDDEKNRVFLEAKLPTVIFVTRKQESISPILVRTHKGRFIEEGSDAAFLTPEIIIKLDEKGAVIPSCTQRDLEILISIFSDNSMKKISDYCQASQGEINETADGKKGYVSRNHQDGPHILRGSNICLYILREASQGEPIYLRKEEYLNGKPDSIKAQHHLQNRIGWQESSAQNNFRRIIAAKIPRDMFCNHKINYIPEGDSSLNLDLLLAILNSKISDWLFRLSSTSAAVSHYQILRLPIPYIKNTERCEVVDNMINLKHWYKLKSFALNACTKPGSMPNVVAYALIEMSRQISKSESARKLNNRSERSSLSPESQEIQDVIDSLLFRCYGLSEEEGEYIATRLKEML